MASAASSAERSAAALPMGGFGLPLRTATPVRTTPRSTGESGSTWPRRAGDELVAHGPDGTKGSSDVAAGLGLELRRERCHQPLRRTAAQKPELHRLASTRRGDDALARDGQIAHAHAEGV